MLSIDKTLVFVPIFTIDTPSLNTSRGPSKLQDHFRGESPSKTEQVTWADCPANTGVSPNVNGFIFGNTIYFVKKRYEIGTKETEC